MSDEIIRIITGSRPDRLESFAAEELKKYIEKLFGSRVRIVPYIDNGDQEGGCAFILASPLKEQGGKMVRWEGKMPVLSEQGFVIRNDRKGNIWLFGGTPAATLWAVYELVESWGVVYSLQGDVIPEYAGAMTLPRGYKIYEPRQKMRYWRVVNVLVTGPESWSLAQQEKFIPQLVKQKYNGIHMCLWAHHPYVNFTVDGISKRSATFNFGIPIPITKDNIGRELLPRKDFFTNPEFLDCGTYEELHETGKKYINTVIGYAKSFGMQVDAAFQPFDYTQEYAGLLEKPVIVKQLGQLCITEGGDLFNPSHIKLLHAQLDAFVNTYPDIDSFYISFPEHARNAAVFDESWARLDKRFGLSSRYDIDRILNDSSSINTAAGGPQRAVDEAKMMIVMLDTLHKLMDLTGFVGDVYDAKKELGISAGLSCPQFLPVMSDALWPDASMLISTGYTASRGIRNLRKLDAIDASRIKMRQVLTLQDDNIGSLPQITTYSIQRLLEYGIDKGWDGYNTRFWPIGDLDPISAYLSSASWKEETTPDTAYRDYAGRLYGEDTKSIMSQALRLLEDATILLDTDHLIMLFPARIIVGWHMGAEAKCIMTESLWHVKAIYEEVRSILKGQLDRIKSEQASAHLLYMINRMDFSERALAGISMIEEGNKSLRAGDKTAAKENYENAVGCFRQAVEYLAKYIRDDSDVGNLAIYYDVLVREVEKRIGELIPENDD